MPSSTFLNSCLLKVWVLSCYIFFKIISMSFHTEKKNRLQFPQESQPRAMPATHSSSHTLYVHAPSAVPLPILLTFLSGFVFPENKHYFQLRNMEILAFWLCDTSKISWSNRATTGREANIMREGQSRWSSLKASLRARTGLQWQRGPGLSQSHSGYISPHCGHHSQLGLIVGAAVFLITRSPSVIFPNTACFPPARHP